MTPGSWSTSSQPRSRRSSCTYWSAPVPGPNDLSGNLCSTDTAKPNLKRRRAVPSSRGVLDPWSGEVCPADPHSEFIGIYPADEVPSPEKVEEQRQLRAAMRPAT
jgi:hypothetical protein